MAVLGAEAFGEFASAASTVVAVGGGDGALRGAFGFHQPDHVDDARKRTDSVGAAGVADQHDLVAQPIARCEHTVGAFNLAVDAPACHHVPGAAPVAPLDPGLIMDGEVGGAARLVQEFIGNARVGFAASVER